MDEYEYLAEVLAACRSQVNHLPTFGDSDDEGTVDLWLASTAILFRGLHLAEGLAVLLAPRRVRVATGPVFRALFELSVDFRHLIERGDPKMNATKLLITGILEELAAREDIKKGGAESPPDEELIRMFDDVRERSPEAVTEVLEQRAHRRYHWSGETQTQLMSLATGQPIVYRILSWDAHPAVGAARSFRVERDTEGGTLSFEHESSRFFTAAQLALFTANAVAKMWDRYATLWNVDRDLGVKWEPCEQAASEEADGHA